MKKICLYFLLLCFAFSLTACGKADNASPAAKQPQDKLNVVVSFNAMKEIAEAIGKDKVDIKTIIPDGTEPHDFEPKADDIKKLSAAKIFIINGLGMEKTWADKAIQAAANKDLAVITASKGITPIGNTDQDAIETEGQDDPHIWLSLKCAQQSAKNINDAFAAADPANKDYYDKNYLEFCQQLTELYNEYDKKFTSVSKKDFVTGHAAFAYLARDFSLQQNSVEDVFAAGEPSGKKLKELTDYCKEHQIKTIFVEDMVSPKVSETLANEVGAKAEKIYTLESKEDNKDYLQSMHDNLEKLYLSLQ
ncbi:MAG: metal ABC transporter substrate-binding protein [Pelosinus sp.]|nr:metal ABC transporter substrate-binding protein [Pelosinus sp.]